jgi:hypothetical protein
MAIINRHMRDPRPHLAAVVPGIDGELADLCQRMMAIESDDRPDFAELVPALERITARLQGDLPVVSRVETTGSHATIDEPVAVRSRRARSGDNGDNGDNTNATGTLWQSTWISQGAAGVPGWAIIVTILCAAVFLVGLGLRLAGP